MEVACYAIPILARARKSRLVEVCGTRALQWVGLLIILLTFTVFLPSCQLYLLVHLCNLTKSFGDVAGTLGIPLSPQD